MKRKNKSRFSARIFSIVVAIALLPGALHAQDEPKLVHAFGWDRETQGAFVTSVAVDLQNNVWAGTEGNGLWRYDSRKKEWSHFTADEGLGGDPVKQGLGDEYVYALAVDKLGRLWAGSLNHGVSVFNGEKWKTYDVAEGPLGSRVFAITTCPTDGDVWIATDCGVARYSLANDDWDYYTRASGLPSNQIQAIAFDSKGNIYLGTQCDGIAMATTAENYKKWTSVTAPGMPVTATGDGLPSGLINDITVLDGDKIVAATPEGAGESDDGGKTWKFVRGKNWKNNVNGLYPAAPVAPESDTEAVFAEDWISTIRQDQQTKNVWIGYWKLPAELRGPAMDKVIATAEAGPWENTVRAICLPAKGPPLIAISDVHVGGLMTVNSATAELEPGGDPRKTAPQLPSPAKAPDAATLAALAKRIGVFKAQLKAGEGYFLGDDWRTQGDWVGRYGNSYAMLCGLGDAGTFQSEPDYAVQVGLGPHTKNNASDPETYVRNRDAGNLRIPYDPASGHRVEAELNDLTCHWPTYPDYWDGPDLWVDVTVPAGLHRVSLYFDNNDGQAAGGGNLDFNRKFRDYDLQLLPWAEDKDAVQKSQPLARARVVDFRGGVYKRFVVAGPAHYIFRVGRNHSFGTKIMGVFIDRIAGDLPATHTPLPGFDQVKYAVPALKDKSAITGNAALSAPDALWSALDLALDKPGAAGLQYPLRVISWRAVLAAGNAPAEYLDALRWRLGIWTKEDRDAFDKATAEAFKAYSDKQKPEPEEQ
ncbi:MAG TPA: two-component regulator propeller domain-containing protein [Chthoniobacteraceae bacterium]|nr:two-component regulator propeller domain-containing protein [Chthoniobacteraceae bacterium]